MSVSRSELPGLQAERTLLAWERTALGLLANGALLMLRGADDAGLAVLLPAAAALALALVAAVTGLRRRHRIAQLPAGQVPEPSVEVLLLGTGVTVLCVLTIVVTLT